MEPPPQRGGGTTNPRSPGRSGGGSVFEPGGYDRRNENRRVIIEPDARAARQSRSGVVRYGTIFNGQTQGRLGPIQIGRAPNGFGGLLERKVNQQERIGLVANGYRYGYYHYDRNWRDDYFGYPHYVFDPFGYNRVNYSPWYYYASCPPYINSNRVVIINSFPVYNYSSWDNYRWSRPDRYNNDRWGQRNDLDYAIEDIVASFEEGDRRAISRLIPRNGNVHIYMDGQYRYSLGPDDFYDLYYDGIDNVRTRNYEIVSARFDGRDRARVEARHEFIDPWNRRALVNHYYILERERGNFVIREFGTSEDRGW